MEQISLNPLVSVLMTAYNRGKYIGIAIESVLASTYKNFELIIVDDGSNDNTVKIAQEYVAKDHRIKLYINEKNLGDYPNRNKAASFAKGKYIKYLDSDDYIYPHGLWVMVNSMEQFSDAGFGIMSRGDYVSPYPKQLSPKEAYREHFMGYGHFHRAPGSGIINLKAFNEVGGFSGRNVIGDVEFWLKIAIVYPMVKISDDLYWPRSHGDQQKDSVTGKQYEALIQEVTGNALLNPRCPLTKEDIAMVKKNIKMNKRKNNIFTAISKFKSIFGK